MNVLIAGAGGALGRRLVERYLEQGDAVTALVLRVEEMEGISHLHLRVIAGNVTRPETIRGICDQMKIVISCIGITRIKGNLTHVDVDYKGNLTLLQEAERAGVKKFGFISPAGTNKGMGMAPLLDAKYRFEEALRSSTVPWVIFRSGGFFPDLAEMMKLAAKGPLFVIGDGSSRSTPICVKDLAMLMEEGMRDQINTIVEVGGPEDLSWLDVCRICFEVQNRPVRVMRIPVWLCRLTLPLVRPFSFRNYAMGKLLLFMSTNDVCTPPLGTLPLRNYLRNATEHS